MQIFKNRIVCFYVILMMKNFKLNYIYNLGI